MVQRHIRDRANADSAGPQDLCPGTAVWVVSERVGVSSVGVSGVSAVSDVSECRSLTLLTLDRHDPRVSLSELPVWSV